MFHRGHTLALTLHLMLPWQQRQTAHYTWPRWTNVRASAYPYLHFCLNTL